MLEAENLIEKIEPTTHVVPHGDRSGAVVEPYLTDQWYVDAKTLAQPAIEAVRAEQDQIRASAVGGDVLQLDGEHPALVHFTPNLVGSPNPGLVRARKNQTDPHRLSRFWMAGAIRPEDCKIFVELNEADAIRAAKEYYGSDVIVTKSSLDTSWIGSGRNHIFRDEDVLDTWFSSALWPFSTLGWPDETPELKRFYPTVALVTGFDIIFFWVARMMMMGLHFMKEVPFHDVYIHALVRDATGAKMSKSKGNVIDPLEVIDEYGADALRFTLAAMAAQGRDIKLSAQRVEGYRNFATKLWNAARFAEINGCSRDPDFDPIAVEQTINRWIMHETANAAGVITAAIKDYKFNDAATMAYRFVWNQYCDWYLEACEANFARTKRTGER